MAFDVPQVNVQIRPFAQPLNYATQLAALMLGGGHRGARSYNMGGLGGTVKLSSKERQELRAEQAKLAAMQTALQDPELRAKTAGIDALPVADQRAVLQDIRRNDIGRISKATGVDSGELFDALLGPTQFQVNRRYEAVRKDAGSLSSMLQGLRMGTAEIVGEAKGLIKSGEEARAVSRETTQTVEDIKAENPAYWEDQAKREARGDLITGTGATGSFLTNLSRMLPGAAATIGAGVGAAAAAPVIAGGTAATGLASAILGALGAGTVGAAIGSQDFINRVEQDPRLSEEQKTEAISSGRLPAAGAAGLFNAIPINANPLSQSLLGAARNNIIGRTAQTLGQSLPGRLVGNTALSAAELSVGNAGDVLSRNAIYGAATGQETPLTEGLGQALVQGAALAPVFGVARTPLNRGIPRSEAPTAPQSDTTQTTAQPVTPAQTLESGETSRGATVDEDIRAGFRTAVANKEITDVQDMYEAYIAGGKTPADWRAFLEADANSTTPLGPAIVERGLGLVPEAQVLRDLDAAEMALVSEIRQRVLNGEDLTLENAREMYTGDFDTPLTDSVSVALGDGYRTRQNLATSLFEAVKPLGRKETDMPAFQNALREYFAAGGTESLLNRILEDAKKNKANRGPLSPIQGKLTNSQRSSLTEALSRNKMEDANVASTAVQQPSNVGRDDSGPAVETIVRNIVGDSGGEADSAATIGDIAARVVRENSGSDGTAEGGRVGGAAQPDQRTSEAPNVSFEGTRPGSAPGETIGGPDTGRQSGSGTTDTRSGIVEPPSVRDASDTGDATATGSNVTPGSEPLVTVKATRLGGAPGDANWGIFDGRTGELVTTGELTRDQALQQAGRIASAMRKQRNSTEMAIAEIPPESRRIVEEIGEVEVPPHTTEKPAPFTFDIPEAPKIVKLLDSETANKITNELAKAIKVDPAKVNDHLAKYMNQGGTEFQLQSAMKAKRFPPRDRLLLMRALDNMSKPAVDNILAVRDSINKLSAEALAPFSGKGKPPKTERGIASAQERLTNLLVREASGDASLSKADQAKLKAAHDAGVPPLTLTQNMIQSVADAKMEGMDVTPEGLIKANTDISDTIRKITYEILCRAI